MMAATTYPIDVEHALEDAIGPRSAGVSTSEVRAIAERLVDELERRGFGIRQASETCACCGCGECGW